MRLFYWAHVKQRYQFEGIAAAFHKFGPKTPRFRTPDTIVPYPAHNEIVVKRQRELNVLIKKIVNLPKGSVL